jgi:uncharacterized protein
MQGRCSREGGGIVGGTPLYPSWWDQEASLAENMLELVGHPGSPLLTEGH